MRKTKLFLLAMITCSIVSCNTQSPRENGAKNETKTEATKEVKEKIGPTELSLKSDIMTPEVLWSMGRIGEYSLSPDHQKIVYAVTYYSVPENRSGSTLYIINADGSNNIKGSWLYSSWTWFVNSYREPLARATNDWLNTDAVPAASSPWGGRAMFFCGSVMAVLTLLRQYFSGFWFHPIGFMLGWTNINNGAPWGTLLVAWAIRLTVLKIGGARAVRNKLLPFFTGAVIGCITSVAVFTVVNTNAFLSGSPNFASLLP